MKDYEPFGYADPRVIEVARRVLMHYPQPYTLPSWKFWTAIGASLLVHVLLFVLVVVGG